MSHRRPERLALLAAALFGAAWILFASEGRTQLPTPPVVGAGLVVVLAGRLLRTRRVPRAVDAALILLVGLAASVAHLVPGIVFGHDTFHHVWGAYAWREAWREGDWFPIWLHRIGPGLPQPLLYGPLAFWAMAPAALAGAGTDVLLRTSFVAANLVSAALAARAVGLWTGDRRAALVAAVAWSFAPYRLLDANYRAGLGETWGLAFLPWVIFSFERLVRGFDRRRFRRAAIATGLLAVAHPLSLVLAALALPLLWAAAAPRGSGGWRERLHSASRSVAAGVAGLALVGAFSVPLFVESRSTSLESTIGEETARYLQHGLHPGQILERRLWSRLDWSLRTTQEGADEVDLPFYLGATLLGGLLVAAAVGFRAGARRSPLRALAFLGLGATVLTWLPVARLTGVFPVTILQFPWRFLGPASAAGALALGLLAARAGHRGRWLVATLAVVALADGFPHTGAVGRARPWDGVAVANLWPVGETTPRPLREPWPFRLTGDFLPPTRASAITGNVDVYPDDLTPAARAIGDRNRLAVELESAPRLRPVWRDGALPYARLEEDEREPLPFRRSGGRIEVETGGRPGRLVVAEQYFPGWQVEGAAGWAEVEPTVDGLLAAEVDAAAQRVRFRFDRWRWDRSLGWLVSLLAWSLFVRSLHRARKVP